MQYKVHGKTVDTAIRMARRQYVQKHHHEPSVQSVKSTGNNKWSVELVKPDVKTSLVSDELKCPKCGISYKTKKGLKNHKCKKK